ncbi:hypothetical protein TNIN_302601 [Trichonephila inaurata madagascariensis]|uniref:Uncharacterized protein n=1 Tax=Trichonephila inaurata madagascariensis TaxID=2747483 RepID=A0A8X6YJS4_9ARAC|nr:hypothetical protein TNIN_302601 [Trichonephila inaurata madagascariensis]
MYIFVPIPNRVEILSNFRAVPLEIACAAHRLQRRCGQLTRSTFVNIIRRMQHLVHPDCKAEDFGALKSAFFEYAKPMMSNGKHTDRIDVLRRRRKKRAFKRIICSIFMLESFFIFMAI